MTAPQIVMIVLLILECIVHMIRTVIIDDKISVAYLINGTIIRMGVIIGVLTWGGFWK